MLRVREGPVALDRVGRADRKHKEEGTDCDPLRWKGLGWMCESDGAGARVIACLQNPSVKILSLEFLTLRDGTHEE